MTCQMPQCVIDSWTRIYDVLSPSKNTENITGNNYYKGYVSETLSDPTQFCYGIHGGCNSTRDFSNFFADVQVIEWYFGVMYEATDPLYALFYQLNLNFIGGDFINAVSCQITSEEGVPSALYCQPTPTSEYPNPKSWTPLPGCWCCGTDPKNPNAGVFVAGGNCAGGTGLIVHLNNFMLQNELYFPYATAADLNTYQNNNPPNSGQPCPTESSCPS